MCSWNGLLGGNLRGSKRLHVQRHSPHTHSRAHTRAQRNKHGCFLLKKKSELNKNFNDFFYGFLVFWLPETLCLSKLSLHDLTSHYITWASGLQCEDTGGICGQRLRLLLLLQVGGSHSRVSNKWPFTFEAVFADSNICRTLAQTLLPNYYSIDSRGSAKTGIT